MSHFLNNLNETIFNLFPPLCFLVVFHSSTTVVKVYADELPRHETQYTKQQNRAFEMAFLQAPIWARKMRVGNSLTFDDAEERKYPFLSTSTDVILQARKVLLCLRPPTSPRGLLQKNFGALNPSCKARKDRRCFRVGLLH